VEDKMMRGEYRPDANDRPLLTWEGVTSLIYEVWPEPTPHNHIHVFVCLPDEEYDEEYSSV
jgi:hypothetical protein